MSSLRRVLVVALIGAVGGCAHRTFPSEDAATQPAEEPSSAISQGVYSNRDAHFKLTIPADWRQTKANDPQDVLTFLAPGCDESGPRLTVTVPKLPPHVPGVIPIGSVEKGYLDDMSKSLKNVKKEGNENVKLAEHPAKKMVASAADDKGPRKRVLVICVRKDKLYLIAGDAPKEKFDIAQKGVDAVMASWAWTN